MKLKDIGIYCGTILTASLLVYSIKSCEIDGINQILGPEINYEELNSLEETKLDSLETKILE